MGLKLSVAREPTILMRLGRIRIGSCSLIFKKSALILMKRTYEDCERGSLSSCGSLRAC